MPARQQTLRATIDWSYKLLGAAEQTLFARLAVFHGGCTLEAAEAVSGSDDPIAGLATLVDDSLLRQEEQSDGEARFTMLETIRAYALERLEASGEADAITKRHAEHFLAVAEQIGPAWKTGDVDFLLLERDHDNFRLALAGLVARDDRESFVRLVVGLAGFWMHRSHVREAAGWSEEAVRLASDLSLFLQAQAWGRATSFAWKQRDLQRAWDLGQQALDAYRGVGDSYREAWSLRQLGVVAQERGELRTSDELYEQAASIFHELGELRALQVMAHDQGTCALQRGDYVRARAFFEENLARSRELRSEIEVGNAFLALGHLALQERRYEDSTELFVASLESAIRYGVSLNVPLSLRGLSASTAVRGDLESAARMLAAAEALQELTGETMYLYERSAYEDGAALVLDRIDEPEIAAAWAAGRAMSEADAAVYALATVAEQTSQL